MTLEEAKKVASICASADNSCSACVQELRNLLDESFPEFNWIFDWKAEDAERRLRVEEKHESSYRN